MAEDRYSSRIFIDGSGIAEEQMDRIEEITVSQMVDRAWEARIKLRLILDEDGNWIGEEEQDWQAFNSVRVELRILGGDWTALIEGPVVGYDNEKSSQPGQSYLIIIVQDNSVLLNRDDEVFAFEDLTDSEIAGEIYGRFPDIVPEHEEESVDPPEGTLPPVLRRRGTAMNLLRFLATRNGKHAYILPGDAPGESKGYFHAFPQETDGLPGLVLNGSARNIDEFHVNRNAQAPANFTARTLDVSDRSSQDAASTNEEFGREGETQDGERPPANRLISPLAGAYGSLQQAVAALTEQSAWAYQASGSVHGLCYHGILSPYRLVPVHAGASRLSGNYLLTEVNHTFDRSHYSQSFKMQRIGSSELDSAGAVPGVF